jgi:hypothetical protein
MSFTAISGRSLPPNGSIKIVAQKPDGSVAPLIWLYGYDPASPHTWSFRKPITLPAGTKVVAGVAVSLIEQAR